MTQFVKCQKGCCVGGNADQNLIQLYESGLSMVKIAEQFGVSYFHIHYRLKALGVKPRTLQDYPKRQLRKGINPFQKATTEELLETPLDKLFMKYIIGIERKRGRKKKK